MKSFTIQLDTQTKFKQCDLDCLICERPFDDDIRIYKRPAVIVVPGGAYSRVSKREGQPIAMQFLAKGFQAFVLRYHVSPDGASYPDHLIELATAVDYVKKNAESLCVNANEVFVVGFSAGGHLVGNLATDHKRVNSYVTKQLDCVPTAVGLAYPVISEEYGHVASFENLTCGLNEQDKQNALKITQLDKMVTGDTVPSFVWTTFEDETVPPLNSIKYVEQMIKNGVRCELHMYPQGWHGLSTCDAEVNFNCPDYLKKNAKWLDECSDFFKLYLEEKI